MPIDAPAFRTEKCGYMERHVSLLRNAVLRCLPRTLGEDRIEFITRDNWDRLEQELRRRVAAGQPDSYCAVVNEMIVRSCLGEAPPFPGPAMPEETEYPESINWVLSRFLPPVG